jgi:hypothetical protein
VEGPLTNLKPSMIALSQPKRKFDRAAFGVGGVGAGSMGAIGRYHPPERVGDPVPGSLAAAATGGAAGGGMGAGAAAAAAMNGMSGGVAGAAAGGFRATDGPGYSPFAGPSYAIPAAGGFDSSRPGQLSSNLSSRAHSSSSQMGLNTQPDFGMGVPGSSQGSFGVGGLGGYGDGVLGAGLSGLLGTQPGIMSQAGAMTQVGGAAGVSLHGLGLTGFPDTQGLSQASFGFGGGADDPYGASLGLGGPGMDASGVLSQAGFDQSQIGDILGPPSTQPSVGNKFGG